MKKMLLLVAAVMVVACAGLFAADGVTPVKISLIPRIGVPMVKIVHGLDLGLLGSNNDEVQGLQLSWIYSGTEKKMVGLQTGFICVERGESIGIQYGFYNSAEHLTGVQLGFINVAQTLYGVQLGLVNVIKKNGALPVMVILNVGF